MSRAQIKVEANESFTIEGVNYRVAHHPALPGIPYVQRGARGFVIKLIRPEKPDSESMALKYFKLKYRVPELVKVAEALRSYADFPGLRAARRTVFTQSTHPDLVVRYPALEYGMMMPWLPGVTWYDIVTTKAALTPHDGLQLAQETSRILANLEKQNIAHCDIAGANVMVARKTGQVELVDIEEMYAPNLPMPVEMPAGQDGYQHCTSRTEGQWKITGDRFASAILLSEMLAWPNGRIRVQSADEHFFATSEMQDKDSLRFRLMCEVLRDGYGPEPVELLETAWHSRTVEDCPPLSTWRDVLEKFQVEARSEQPLALSPSPVISGRRVLGPSAPAGAEQPQHTGVEDRLKLDSTRLCRNCGEPNDVRESFCKRCGFYIGVGVRKPVAAKAPAERSPGAKGQTPPRVTVPPPQAVALNRNMSEIVTARRLGDPTKGLTRVEAPKPHTDEPVEANAGSWLVVALIIGFGLALLALVLIAR